MAEFSGPNPATRIWIGRTVFLFLSIGLMFLSLLPLETTPRGWAPPNFLLAFACIWAVRRPTYLPTILVGLVFLMSDLLFLRPPGLWAGIVVIGTEILRSRSNALRNVTLIVEWLTVAGVIIAMTLVYRIVLAAVVVQTEPLGLAMIQMMLTILIYPVLVGISHFGLGVRKSAPGQVDALGHRL